jgi:hypothetical protein
MNTAQLTALRRIVANATITEVTRSRLGWEIHQNGKLKGICLTHAGAMEYASLLETPEVIQ